MRALLLTIALCQTVAAPAQPNTGAKSAGFQKQGKDALEREQVRAKQSLCEKTANNLDWQFCLKAEFQKTDANRLAYVRAIGGLLRLSLAMPQASARPQRLSFDDGETAWVTYRDRTCQAIYETYQGGSGAAGALWNCQITATRNHMQDVSQIYSELWH